MRRLTMAAAAACTIVLVAGSASASSPGADVRLTRDNGGGYVSAYTLGTGVPYTDGILGECTISRGRQNEPAVAVDPRNTKVILGSSNDYCGVYGPPGDPTTGSAAGPIWLGYYRSENAGGSFVSSLIPGYPGDSSPYAALADIRTASAGDPVIAWDAHGRAFFGSESSGDPGGSPKGFGDQWVATYVNAGGGTINDGKRYVGTVTVARGSSSPAAGKFHDKTAIEADRTGGQYDGNVYFAWSRFTANKNSNIYFVRSTDHGRTFSTPKLLTPNAANLQDPRIDVTGNGHVYVTYDVGALNNGQPDGIQVVKSTDGGQTFSKPRQLLTYTPWEATDVSAVDGSANRDCGDFADACQSGFTFFRNDSTTDSAADQKDGAHEYVYLIYNAAKPGTQAPTGNTYGTEGPGTGSQSGAYFVRYDGATDTMTTPKLVSPRVAGHQSYPDISADGGVLHAEWWDSRNDPCYSVIRPIGNCADRSTVAALDVYASQSGNLGATWTRESKLTDVRSNGNWEQFDNRSVPFGGDYLWVSSIGSFAFSVWTDWRDTVAGTDPRETPDDGDGADVIQCRAQNPATGAFGPDTCPHAGGLDQNIYGDLSP
jgi:hypothetical protein